MDDEKPMYIKNIVYSIDDLLKEIDQDSVHRRELAKIVYREFKDDPRFLEDLLGLHLGKEKKTSAEEKIADLILKRAEDDYMFAERLARALKPYLSGK